MRIRPPSVLRTRNHGRCARWDADVRLFVELAGGGSLPGLVVRCIPGQNQAPDMRRHVAPDDQQALGLTLSRPLHRQQQQDDRQGG